MSGAYLQPSRVVLDAHSGAVSGPVRVSYFDPRTGEPCATKPEPLHGDQERRGREREGYRESLERGRKKRAVVVDGVEYESIAAAARAIGVDKTSLGAAMRSGAIEYGGRAVRYAEGPAPAGGKRVMRGHFKRTVVVDGVRYDRLMDAAEAVGCSQSYLSMRLKDGYDRVKGHVVAYA